MIRVKRSFIYACTAMITCLVILCGGCSLFNSSQTEPYPLTRNQQTNIAMGIARYYNVKSIKFLDCYRHKIAGSVHVIVEINDNPDLQNDIVYLDLENLDNSALRNTLVPLNDFEYLQRKPPISEGVPVDMSKIKINYLGK